MISKLFSGPAVLLAALGTLTITLATGCSRGEAHPKMAPPAVTVAPVERQDLVEWDEFTGRTAPIELVEVRPRVSGHIQEIHFESGSLVKKGDVLVKIDPRWHQAEFEHRQADYEQAKVHLGNAEREAHRTTQLLANRAISTE